MATRMPESLQRTAYGAPGLDTLRTSPHLPPALHPETNVRLTSSRPVPRPTYIEEPNPPYQKGLPQSKNNRPVGYPSQTIARRVIRATSDFRDRHPLPRTQYGTRRTQNAARHSVTPRQHDPRHATCEKGGKGAGHNGPHPKLDDLRSALRYERT